MRLDHIAYRVKDRWKTAKFFIDALNYKVQQEFEIDFGNGEFAKCIALEPPEKPNKNGTFIPFEIQWPGSNDLCGVNYHMAPEIFVSDGNAGSIVGDWVEKRNGIGGIHHIAYQVSSVQQTMKEWKEKGYAEFSTENPLKCPGLTQIFTKPSELTGIIYEFIERGEHGFCKDNVKSLMESTKGM